MERSKNQLYIIPNGIIAVTVAIAADAMSSTLLLRWCVCVCEYRQQKKIESNKSVNQNVEKESKDKYALKTKSHFREILSVFALVLDIRSFLTGCLTVCFDRIISLLRGVFYPHECEYNRKTTQNNNKIPFAICRAHTQSSVEPQEIFYMNFN